jgi:hypothetical protein
LSLLQKRLDRVTKTRTGAALAIRGRRQVGKSRLMQEFCDAAGVPYAFFTATKGLSPNDAMGAFLNELRESNLPAEPDVVPQSASGSWLDALRALASALPDTPSIVVIDELPWLAEQDDAFDGALQTAWDRLLSKHPIFLVMLGSDLHMMERLTAYDRPFYGRADSLVLGPLNPAETGQAVGLAGTDAIDAFLISGGLPGILRSWPQGMPPLQFVEQECADPAAPVFSVPESTLLAEFPSPDQARRVLEAVGSGDRTYAAIAAAAGGINSPLASGALSPLLRQLTDEKRVVAVDQPLSTQPGKPNLYRVADSNLRLYLAVLRSSHELVRRGRPEAAFQLFARRWETSRGRAVEPIVRDSLELAAVSGTLPWRKVETVGGWWNRQFDPELDLVGADRYPIARALYFIGSIKWHNSPFDHHDLTDLEHAAPRVPGFDPTQTGLVVVSKVGLDNGVERSSIDLVWTAADVVAAYAPG